MLIATFFNFAEHLFCYFYVFMQEMEGYYRWMDEVEDARRSEYDFRG